VAELDRCGGYAELLKNSGGFLAEPALGGNGIKHYCKWLVRYPGKFDRCTDGLQIEQMGATRNQDQISRPRCSERCGFGIWGSVDDGKLGTTSLGFLQNDGKTVRLCRHNGRGIPVANVAPGSSACLRIKVNDGCSFLIPLCRYRQVDREFHVR